MSQEIDRWIKYMRENPDNWKKLHTGFINAQFSKSIKFIQKLAEQPGGREKIINAYNIKNINGYSELFKTCKNTETEL
ncbi:MAG: hypothetical protein MAG795_01268 [Candidatus Woesearchaeota archaeon]|nr:hypothetical protein [Candidatus Woesearchaeota archaeon]